MNSVHEQCPKSDSEIVLSPKTGWVHQVHSLLAKQHTQARTGTPRCSQWLCRGSPVGCVATPGCRVALPRALAPNAPLRRAPNLMLKWAVAYFNVYTIFIFFSLPSVAFLATSTFNSLNTASMQLNNFMSSTVKFIKILFHYPITQINLFKFI